MERLKFGDCSIKQEKTWRKRSFGARGAGVAHCVLTSDSSLETLKHVDDNADITLSCAPMGERLSI